MCHKVWEQVVWAWRQVLPHLKEAWQASKPYFHQLGKFIIEKSLELWQYLQANFPVYIEMLSKSFTDALQFTANTWQKIVEVRKAIMRNNLKEIKSIFRHFKEDSYRKRNVLCFYQI